MINAEENILNEVMLRLQGKMEIDTLNEVKLVMCSVLHNYNLEEKSHELSVVEEKNNEWFLKMFLVSKKIEGKSQSTLDRYQFAIEKLISYVYKPVTEMTANDIRYFLAVYKKNNSNTTMDGMRRVYSSFFNWLENEDYIEKNPVRKLAKIKWDTVKEQPYTGGEMEAILISTDNTRNKAILTLMYSTAIRVSELAQINLQDIDFQTKTLHILHGKGGKDRYVPLESRTMFYLERWLKERENIVTDSDSLFVSRRAPHDRLKACAIRAMLKKLGVAANISHAHPHRYRVTRITDLLRRGMKLEEVQLIAGHVDINTTANYNRCDISYVDAEFRRKS